MTNNVKVEIDLDKLDADIAETQKLLELLISTKKYALSIAIKANPDLVSKETIPSLSKPKESNAKPAQSKKKLKLSVTEFILKFIKSNMKVDSNAITKAYSVYVNKTEKQVLGNVSNALSRLKSSKKVNNEPKPDGKKGSLWFLTKRL